MTDFSRVGTIRVASASVWQVGWRQFMRGRGRSYIPFLVLCTMPACVARKTLFAMSKDSVSLLLPASSIFLVVMMIG